YQCRPAARSSSEQNRHHCQPYVMKFSTISAAIISIPPPHHSQRNSPAQFIKERSPLDSAFANTVTLRTKSKPNMPNCVQYTISIVTPSIQDCCMGSGSLAPLGQAAACGGQLHFVLK